MPDNARNPVRADIERSIRKDDFRNWVRPVKFVGMQESLLIFHAPTHFLCDWVETNYADKIVRHFAGAGVEAIGGTFHSPRKGKEDVRPGGESEKPKRSRGRKGALPDAPLDRRFTFVGLLRNSSRISGADQEWPACVFLKMKSGNISTDVSDSFSCNA